MQTDL